MLLTGKVERTKLGHCRNSMDNVIFGNVNGPGIWTRISGSRCPKETRVQVQSESGVKPGETAILPRDYLSLQIPYMAAWLSSKVVVSHNSTHWFGSHRLSRVSIAAGWFLAKPELGSVSWHPPYNQKSPARRESGDIGIHHLKQHVRLRCTIHRISQFDQNPSWICPIEDPLSYINPIEAMLLRQWSW